VQNKTEVQRYTGRSRAVKTNI